MATRYLTTLPEWIEALRCGRKTLDARPVTYEVDFLKIGDVVQYPGFQARVVYLRFYPRFEVLLNYEDWWRIAPEASGRDEVNQLLELGYEVTLYASGVVAIELEPLALADDRPERERTLTDPMPV
jgi:ASC-1-like (ASCH) protein